MSLAILLKLSAMGFRGPDVPSVIVPSAPRAEQASEPVNSMAAPLACVDAMVSAEDPPCRSVQAPPGRGYVTTSRTCRSLRGRVRSA